MSAAVRGSGAPPPIRLDPLVKRTNSTHRSVADPGFDLRGGGRGLCQRGVRKSLKVLKVEVKVIFRVFWCRLGHLSIKIRRKMIRERSERGKIEKI